MDHEVPRLVTASFTGYRRDMGTPVRISRGAPRFIHLPDPRYTMNEHWPFVSELAPGYSYMKTAAPTYARYYLKQLEENAAASGVELGEETLAAIDEALVPAAAR